MRVTLRAAVSCALLCACSAGTLSEEDVRRDRPGEPRGPGGPGDSPLPEDAVGISIDTSATDPYVVGFPATWPIVGRVHAARGLDRVEVDGAPAGGEELRVDVPVSAGVRLVPIEAFDVEGASRKGHRSLLVADFLPEGQMNGDGALLALDDAILSSMVGGLEASLADIDLRTPVLSRGPLVDDGTCTLQPNDVTHAPLELHLTVSAAGELVLEVHIPGFAIHFTGTCAIFGSVRGKVETEDRVVIRSTLTAPPPDGGCLVGFDHTPPQIELRGFDMDMSPFLAELGAELSEGRAEDQMRATFEEQAEALLADQLSGISVLDETTTMDLFGASIDVHLCLTELESVGGQLIAHVGTSAQGAGGTLTAPGAPMLPGDVPPAAPDVLFLDANLVTQLLFSAWRGGALVIDGAAELPADLFSAFLPSEVRTRFRGKTMVVSLDARLPAACAAVPEGEMGDLKVILGDLHLFMHVDGELVFEFGSQLELNLELAPTETGELQPTLVDSSATAWLLQEPVADVDDGVLEGLVASQVGASASGLFDGTTIALPDLGGAIAPADVTPDPGGRYLRIALAP